MRRAVACLGVIIGALVAAHAAGLRVNSTASMPRGLWRVVPAGQIARGDIVTACPPASATLKQAIARGYLSAGSCPGGFEPLVKPALAVAGDVVCVTPLGLSVNDAPVPNSAQLAHDSAGRGLSPVAAGRYRVAAGQVWLLASYDPRSFDSRYLGPVPTSAVLGVAASVWTTR